MGNSVRKRKVRPVSEASPPPNPTGPVFTMTSVEYKEKGNKYFAAKKFDQAVQCYTKCILKDPTNPVYFNNRAHAEMQLKQYDEAIKDYKQAIDLDPKNTKGHFCLGKALCLMNRVNEGIKFMKKAIDLANDNIMWKNEMISILQEWELKISTSKEEDLINLHIYLSQLIMDDEKKKISELSTIDECKVTKIKIQTKKRLQDLQKLFMDEEEKLINEREHEIPDYLCCKISLDIFRDPVITPDGVTYDRQWIEHHLNKGGHFDPFTRNTLQPSQLLPNYAMKDVVDNFLAKNEWAKRV